MTDALITLALVAQFLAAFAVPLVPPMLITLTRHRARLALALYAVALVLLVVWVVASYRAGVAADENMTEGSVFAGSAWLGLAVAAAAGSTVTTLTGRPRTRSHGQPAVPGAQ
jgi:signal transduction histidine kinase